MSAKNTVASHPASHPAARRMKLFFGGASALSLVGGAFEISEGLPVVGASLVATGVFFAAFTRWMSRIYAATAVHNRATDMILRGELDGASAALDQIKSMRGAVMQSVALQRATIATLRGDMKSAEKHADACVAASTGIGEGRVRIGIAALSVRAFARASQGNAEGARADIAAVRKTTEVGPLARAAVAELVLLSSENDLEGLVKCLGENERVLEFAAPRERALVRGFERMVARGGSSVYRKPGAREHAESAIGDWGANVAPALRGLMPAETAVSVAEEEPARPAHQAPPIRGKGTSAWRRVLALWLVLVFAFLLIWTFLQPNPTSARLAAPAVESPFSNVAPIIVFGLVLTALVAFAIRRANRRARGLRLLENKVLLGDVSVLSELEATTRGKNRGLSANANWILAQHRERSADFRRVLAHAEEGLAQIETSRAMRDAHSDILVPGLYSQRAIALAGMGREADAVAACDALAAGFPGYAFLSTSIFRAKLIAAARARDFPRAWDVAQTRGADMSISYRDEFLCALLEAQFKGVGQDEHARLGQVLRRNTKLRTWIRTVAPGLTELLGFVAERIDARADAPPESEEEEEPVSSQNLAQQS